MASKMKELRGDIYRRYTSQKKAAPKGTARLCSVFGRKKN